MSISTEVFSIESLFTKIIKQAARFHFADKLNKICCLKIKFQQVLFKFIEHDKVIILPNDIKNIETRLYGCGRVNNYNEQLVRSLCELNAYIRLCNRISCHVLRHWKTRY
jgi:hypothetical protein